MANLSFQVNGDVQVSGNFTDPTDTTLVPASSFIPYNIGLTSNIQTQLNSGLSPNAPTLTSANLINSGLVSNVFVAIAYTSTTAASSTDGITWTTRTMPSAQNWLSVTYGNGTFVAIAYSSTTTAASSTDGITWTTRTMPSVSLWHSVTYGNGTFVAIAYGSTTAASSTDGITWTTRTLPLAPLWQSVTYGNGTFVAIAYATTTAATSTDGITWTTRTLSSAVNWISATYGNGTFVAVASNTTTVAASSTDGITWTTRTLPSSAQWYSAAYGNGTFVVISTNSTTAASSTDGITWTTRTLPSAVNWFSATYGNGTFVVISNNSTTAASSTDGITWTLRTLPSSAGARSVTAAPIQNNINSQSIQGQYIGPLQTSSSQNYTVGPYDKTITYLAAALNTIILPNAALYPNREITMKNTTAFAVKSASSNVIPLASNTAGTAILASTAGKYAKLVSDGNFWVIMEAN